MKLDAIAEGLQAGENPGDIIRFLFENGEITKEDSADEITFNFLAACFDLKLTYKIFKIFLLKNKIVRRSWKKMMKKKKKSKLSKE